MGLVRLALGMLIFATCAMAQAAESTDTVVELYKAVLIAYSEIALEKGDSAYHAGNYEEAIELYNQAIVCDTDNAQAYSSLGLAYQRAGMRGKAIEANNQAIERATDDTLKAMSYYNLARIYEDMGMLGDSIFAYKKALSYRQRSEYETGLKRVTKLNYDLLYEEYCPKMSVMIENTDTDAPMPFLRNGKLFTGVACIVDVDDVYSNEGWTYIIPYKDGLFDGVFKARDVSDDLDIIGYDIPYKNGIKHGEMSSREARRISSSATYENGKLNGLSTSFFHGFYDEDFYEDDRLLWTKHHSGDKLMREYDYVKNLARGYYAQSDALLYEGAFLVADNENILQGLVKFYHEDGELQAEIPYHNGEKDGEAKYYNEDGSLFSQATYKDDNVIEGTIFEYSVQTRAGWGEEYETVYVIESYKNGKLDGISSSSTYRDGWLTETREYKDGVLVSEHLVDD